MISLSMSMPPSSQPSQCLADGGAKTAQVRAVVEYQLDGLIGHGGAQDFGVGVDLVVGTGLVAVFEERDAGIGE